MATSTSQPPVDTLAMIQQLFKDIISEKDARLKDQEARLKDLISEKDARLKDLISEKDARLKEKDELIAEKDLRIFSSLRDVSAYKVVLEPRTLLEVALNAKYGRTGSTTSKWERFFKDVCTNAEPEIKELMKELGCTESHQLLVSNLQVLYSLLSNKVHSPTPKVQGVSAGFCCGGDSSAAACAGAIGVKLLMDDPDVQKSGIMPAEVYFLDHRYQWTHTFRAGHPPERVSQPSV